MVSSAKVVLAILIDIKSSSFQLLLLQFHKGAADAWLNFAKKIVVTASEVTQAKASSTPPTISIPVLTPRTFVV